MNGHQAMGVKCQSEGKNSTTDLPSLETIILFLNLTVLPTLSFLAIPVTLAHI